MWRGVLLRPAIIAPLCELAQKEESMATLANESFGKEKRSTPAKRRGSQTRRRENLYGYLFLTPWLLGFFCLFVGPGLASLYLSLTKYDVLAPPQFLGAANYVKMFTDDDLFWPSLWRTFYFALLGVPSVC